MKDFDLGSVQTGAATGLDDFLSSSPIAVSGFAQKKASAPAQPRVKVGSIAQLNGFNRLSSDTLIHKSTKDLWSIVREGQELYIQRLVSDEAPLKEG